MESLESVENLKAVSFIVQPIVHVTPGRTRKQVRYAQGSKDLSRSPAKSSRRDPYSDSQPRAGSTGRGHCATERLSGMIFQTEVDLSAKVEYSPMKRLPRDSTQLKSTPVLKMDSQLLTRSSLYSRSARRQDANLYMPRVEVRALSRGRSIQHL